MRVFIELLAAVVLTAAPASAETFDDFITKAGALYQEGRYQESATQYELAFALEAGRPTHYYNAACSWSLAGNTESAFAMLDQAIDAGFRNTELLMADTDLVALHGGPRWDSTVSRCQAAEVLWLTTINVELYRLFQSDQADRSSEGDWENIEERDRQRREMVAKMIRGRQAPCRRRLRPRRIHLPARRRLHLLPHAHELAMKAVEIEPAHMQARWIAAASKDRYLQSIGQPQIYGTQLLRRDGRWTLEPYDTTAVTDEERARWGVPPLERQRAWEAQANEKNGD